MSLDYLADDRAGSALDLAALLVRLARQRSHQIREPFPLPALGISGRRSDLHRKITMLVADRPPLATRCQPAGTAALVAILGLTALGASGWRLDAAPPIEPGPVPAAAPPEKPAAIPAAGNEWSGTIVARATGQPTAGARVRVNLQLSRDPRTGGWSQIRDVESTAADGKYRFTLTDAEQVERYLYVTLFVRHPEHVSDYGGCSVAMILRNIDLGERPFFERLALPPGVAVSSQLLRPDGSPAAGVKVNAYSTPATKGPVLDGADRARSRGRGDGGGARVRPGVPSPHPARGEGRGDHPGTGPDGNEAVVAIKRGPGRSTRGRRDARAAVSIRRGVLVR